MSRTRRVREGLGATYVSFLVKAGLKLAVTPFYLARLGPELMGFNSFIGGTIAHFNLMDFGIGTGLTAIVAKDLQPGASESEREAVRRTLRAGGQIQVFFALVAVVLSVAIASFVELLAKGLPEEHVRMAQISTVIFGLSFALYMASRVYKALLVGKQLIALNTLLSVLAAILGAAVGVGLVAAGWSLYGLAIAAVSGAIFFFVQVRWRARRLGVRLQLLQAPIEFDGMRKLARLSVWIFLATVGGLFSLNSARIILGLIPSQGMSAVNKYALLMAVPTMIRLQANRISVVVRPGLTQLMHSETGGDRARELARLLVRVTGILGAVVFAGIFFVNGAFVMRWVGLEYFAGATANFLVAVLVALTVWLFGFKVLMEVRFDFKDRGLAFLAAGITTVALSIALAPSHGISGVLAAGIAGEVVAAMIWVIPSGMRWLVRRDARIRDVTSLVWLPMGLVFLSAYVGAVARPLPASWLWIIGSSFLIALLIGGSGLIWLRADLAKYAHLRNTRDA
jgi:O-antigen/teichoic acid export membrane protein